MGMFLAKRKRESGSSSEPTAPPRLTGTEIVASLAPTLSAKREDQIAWYAAEGHVPDFLHTWIDVRSQIPGHVAVIRVLPDYFALGTDDDFVRVPMNPLTAQQIGDSIGAMFPTRKIVNLIHEQAPCKIPAKPWGPPYDASMLTTDRFAAHNAKIEKTRSSMGCELGVLTSGHKKDVVIGKGLATAKNKVGIYGWFAGPSTSTVIQGPPVNFGSHEITYADYSHGIRYVAKQALVDGQVVNVDDVLRDPELSALLSDEGPLSKTRYG